MPTLFLQVLHRFSMRFRAMQWGAGKSWSLPVSSLHVHAVDTVIILDPGHESCVSSGMFD